MESNSVSPMPELAPIAEFDKTPPTPPDDDAAAPAPDAAAEEEEEAAAVANGDADGAGGEAEAPGQDLPPPPASAAASAAATATPPSATTVNVEDKEKEAEGHRHYEDENEWGCGSWFEYTLVVVLASILLLGSLGLTLYWVIMYQGGFAWRDNIKKQFNLHPVLMVAGFITFSGFSILMYRICRCCRRIYVKLLHTVFHALTIPCVAIGFLAVLDSHNLAQPDPIPNFYSLHSWIGLVTMGLFAMQFVVGFFSFLVLLCCEGATSAFRAALVPIHASFGLTTFMLAIAACLTGLTEKVIFTLGHNYGRLPEEAYIVNAIAMALVALAILIAYILHRDEFRFRAHVLIRDNYTKWAHGGNEEGIIVNALAMSLVALGILVSFAVREPNLRGDSKEGAQLSIVVTTAPSSAPTAGGDKGGANSKQTASANSQTTLPEERY